MKTTFIALALFFFIFDLSAKILYVEPVRNAKYVSINNNVIIGFNEKIINSDLSKLIIVTGDISGIHSGEIIITADERKLIFKPYQPFAFNERVEVKLNLLKTSPASDNRLEYSFQTQVNKPEWNDNMNWSDESEYPSKNNFYNYDNNYGNLPQFTVTVSTNPSPGHLFVTSPRVSTYSAHTIIANNDGTLFHFKEFPANALDYKRQPNGLMTYFSSAAAKFYAEDSQYNIVDSFYCGNGYSTDVHELKILNNGHALLMSYDRQEVDMSKIVPGGNPQAIVTGLIIQEIDENKNVVFQWRSWDHFLITDAPFINLTGLFIDYVHGNAIEPDSDGNLMISSRHMNEITKINRTTGDIIWRMGGVNNQFTFVNDTIPFHYQHDIRRISNGNVTLYDNGNFRTPSFSRALEYQLDEANKTATLVWYYRNSPDIYGQSQGSVQRLRNGNTLIGWATFPTMTEVTPSGNVVFQMSLPVGLVSYRVFRDEVSITLNTKLAIEGFYNPQSNRLNMKDTVTAYLRNSASPFNAVDSSKSVVDSVNFNGNFRFYNASSGTYYISTKHRNGLETWSKAGGESFAAGDVYAYDFTNSDTKAYGNNLVLKDSKYCIYSGDVNQDGFIDLTDVNLVFNDAGNFIAGYVKTDVTGDNISDLTDLTITYNNSSNFVSVMKP